MEITNLRVSILRRHLRQNQLHGTTEGLANRAMSGCNHVERVRIERFLAAGASIKGAARKFAINYHALRRHWRNHVSAEARAAYIAGAGATKDQLEETKT
jgi:hypothetical protein